MRIEGLLDSVGGRVLRHVDAHLHSVSSSAVDTEHLLVDLTAATSTTRGMRILPHLQHTVAKQRLRVHLVGIDGLAPALTRRERAALGGLPVPDRRCRAEGPPTRPARSQ
ncbi:MULTISPECIES: hypothetical protein [unclassified Pseudonocardia]|uniref:hypothetical protein n=1 Tax=unclassified Pseudonocardia TaxID=2619320 RepID=UPI0011AE7ABD|nr:MULTISPECIES: hypothetical protein [unclassified Pseudonocardia]